MKLMICPTLAMLLCLSSAYSQPKDESMSSDDVSIFAKIFASYSVSTPGSFKAPSSQTVVKNAGNSSYGFQTQKKGLGAGFRFGAGFGLILNKYINIGVDGEYLMGTKLTSFSSSDIKETTQVNFTTQPDNTVSSNSYEIAHRILSIIPHVTFKAISTQNYYIYTRVGVIVGIPLQMEVNEKSHSNHTIGLPPAASYPDYDFTYYTDIDASSVSKFKSNPGIGYQAALGIQLKLTGNLRFYVEAVSNSLVFHPVEYEQTSSKRTTETQTVKKDSHKNLKVVDNSRNIQHFKTSGTNTVTFDGAPLNQTVSFQSSKISIPVNSLNIAGGLAFRF